MDSKERWPRLGRQPCLPGYAGKDAAIACFERRGLETCLSPFAVDRGEAVPPICCSGLSSKIQATAYDQARQDGHLGGAQRRLSRHGAWVEYEAPIAESYRSACRRV